VGMRILPGRNRRLKRLTEGQHQKKNRSKKKKMGKENLLHEKRNRKELFRPAPHDPKRTSTYSVTRLEHKEGVRGGEEALEMRGGGEKERGESRVKVRGKNHKRLRWGTEGGRGAIPVV